MAKGFVCPNCKCSTFHKIGNSFVCSKCNTTGGIPSESKQGKGFRCPICKKQTIINGTCTNCKGTFSLDD